MGKIINTAIMTPTNKNRIWTMPTLRQEGDTILDDLNRQIKFLKGIDILTY